MPSKFNRTYGWKGSQPPAELGEVPFKSPWAPHAILPASINLTAGMPPVYDQGQWGSCVSNATAAALDFERKRQKEAFISPSRFFIYFNGRQIEGDPIGEDTGLFVRDGVKSVSKYGACPEAEWPYITADFAATPSAKAYADAKKARAIGFLKVTQTLSQMQGCLALGFPFVFGFEVFDSFESDVVASSGVVPMPNTQIEQDLGGHSVVCVGYDNATQRFRCRNSWGTSWGQAGYFTMPYAYLTSQVLSADFWTIRVVM